ncbi:hypothetical protein VZ95_16865 [Elstera litoralis]|uniref:Outer membrane protein beta-barrel domain-containing protein n=1 Tax=Elstera litoralis TaxID=552518 RepID=A0A0F3IPX3_9PROT|nr:MipA/OmpV family protein [Elstera litoralis]KJV08583.1 hypothetical protein VZ95_16865 [Elstera litoralis]
MIDRNALRWVRGLGLSALLVTSLPAFAQNPPKAAPGASGAEKPASAWSFSLGAGAMFAPKYEGSDRLAFGALPLAEVTWNDRLFASTTRGVGGYIVSTDAFRVSAALGYAMGRDEKDGKRKDGKANLLRGLGDIDGAATLSLGAEYEYSHFTAGLTAQRYIGGSDGFTVTASLGAKLPVTDRLMLGVELQSTWPIAPIWAIISASMPPNPAARAAPVTPQERASKISAQP